jgi:hypothetical protein
MAGDVPVAAPSAQDETSAEHGRHQWKGSGQRYLGGIVVFFLAPMLLVLLVAVVREADAERQLSLGALVVATLILAL